MRAPSALLTSLLLLVGCSGRGQIVGGPCSYETSTFSATVMGHDTDTVTLAGPGGDTFLMELRDFPAPPNPGEVVNLEKDSITSGTCTPFIYRVI
ncbi:MAG: hypothetical protein RLO80_11505 [Hyphomonas sp.]